MDSRLFEYLRQMSQTAQEAIDFLAGMTFAEFEADNKTQRAVAMTIVIFAESASNLEEHFPAFVKAHPEIPWVEIRGMRNRIAHNDFVVNFEIIWETVQSELPLLVQQISLARDGQR